MNMILTNKEMVNPLTIVAFGLVLVSYHDGVFGE